jgi:hypothetical protein
MEDCIPVRDVTVRRFGEDVLVEGYVDGERNPDPVTG